MVSKKDMLFLLSSSLVLPERETDYLIASSGIVIANGTCPLEKINELLHVQLQSTYHSVTLGGFLTEKFGTIPQSGEQYREQGLFFRILSSDPTRIKKVYIKNMNPKKETQHAT
jgi:CBS domain containing-hemolysin-like protein